MDVVIYLNENCLNKWWWWWWWIWKCYCSVAVARSEPKQPSKQHCSSVVPWEPSRVREESGSDCTGQLDRRL